MRLSLSKFLDKNSHAKTTQAKGMKRVTQTQGKRERERAGREAHKIQRQMRNTVKLTL